MWRVIWQHNATIMGTVAAGVAPDSLEVANVTQPLWRDLDTLGSAEPVFQEHPTDLRAWLRGNPTLLADSAMDLASYFHIFVNSYQHAVVLVGRLRAQPTVNYAEMQGRLRHPVMFGQTRRMQTLDMSIAAAPAQTPPLVGEQGYLRPAPAGVDALFAWTVSGGQGAGIRICDVESGWNFHHEDLLTNNNGLIYGQNDYVHNSDGTDSDSQHLRPAMPGFSG
jgi:hypothetical protein